MIKQHKLDKHKNLKQLFLATVLLISLNLFGQISYEKGYFIDLKGNKTECFILNKGWLNNPEFINYKISQDSQVLKISTTELDLLHLSDFTFERHLVDYDTSSNTLSELSTKRSFYYTEKSLFLKLLVDGKAKLYLYKKKNVADKFFYFSPTDNKVRPLSHKRYLTSNNSIGANEQYKQTLFNLLQSEKLKKSAFTSLSYSQKSLVRVFQKYNNEEGGLSPTKRQNKSKIRYKVNGGVSISLISVAFSSNDESDDFEKVPNFTMDFEVENILDFGKNKWSLFGGIGYEKFTFRNEQSDFWLSILKGTFGARHYIFLNDKSKLFLNIKLNAITPLDYSFEPDPFRRLFSFHRNYTWGVGYDNSLLQINANYNTRALLFESGGRNDLLFGSLIFTLGVDIGEFLKKVKK